MKNNCLQVNVDTQKVVLTSKSLFYKTENFIKQTKYIANIKLHNMSCFLFMNAFFCGCCVSRNDNPGTIAKRFYQSFDLMRL